MLERGVTYMQIVEPRKARKDTEMDEPLYTEESYAIRELKAVKAIVPVGEGPCTPHD